MATPRFAATKAGARLLNQAKGMSRAGWFGLSLGNATLTGFGSRDNRESWW